MITYPLWNMAPQATSSEPTPPPIVMRVAAEYAQHMLVGGLAPDKVEEVQEKVGPDVAVLTASGSFKYVLLVGEWVIKVDRGGKMGNDSYVGVVGEAQIMARLKREHADLSHHLPATYVVSAYCTVQERCDLNGDRFRQQDPLIHKLSQQLYIGDVHSQNVGFRKDGTPVFIDVQTDSHYSRSLPELAQYGKGQKINLNGA
jgi:hypothetical protein